MLRRLGGREIAAICGAIIAARPQRIPVILDGYVVTAAAAILHALEPSSIDHCLAGHLSAEGAHRRGARRLGKQPLLALDMRLGEGTGAALAASLVKAAAAIHSGMATFDRRRLARPARSACRRTQRQSATTLPQAGGVPQGEGRAGAARA